MTFAATIQGGRVRVSEIVAADRANLITSAGQVVPASMADSYCVVVKVKGTNAPQHVGPFPSRDAATKWCDLHLPITP